MLTLINHHCKANMFCPQLLKPNNNNNNNNNKNKNKNNNNNNSNNNNNNSHDFPAVLVIAGKGKGHRGVKEVPWFHAVASVSWGSFNRRIVVIHHPSSIIHHDDDHHHYSWSSLSSLSSLRISGWNWITNLNMKWTFIIVDKGPGTSPVVSACFSILQWILAQCYCFRPFSVYAYFFFATLGTALACICILQVVAEIL